ncbi:MmcB family DNA repair protein [Agaricicola taiwanensis]|nr:MmcB family DNA repair protein [Agaricicola taiwanensis]
MENNLDLSPVDLAELSGCGPCRPEATLAICRGTARFLRSLNLACVLEFPLPSGRRADIAALGPKGEFWIIEVKSSLEDFRVDRKWQEYRQHCDRLFFSVAIEFPQEVLPPDAGLVVADAYGGQLLRPAPEHRLSAHTRKALTLRFARLAAARCHASIDPPAFAP